MKRRGIRWYFSTLLEFTSISKEQFGSQKSHDIHERINTEAYASLSQADVIIRLLDPTRSYGVEDEHIDGILESIDTPTIRVETKQDIIVADTLWKIKEKKNQIQKGNWDLIDGNLQFMEGKVKESSFNMIMSISVSIRRAKKGFDSLLEKILSHLPEGEFLYPSDYYTDQTMDLRISEVIREQLFSRTRWWDPVCVFCRSYADRGKSAEKVKILKTCFPSKPISMSKQNPKDYRHRKRMSKNRRNRDEITTLTRRNFWEKSFPCPQGEGRKKLEKKWESTRKNISTKDNGKIIWHYKKIVIML
jgi:hypothetical protein